MSKLKVSLISKSDNITSTIYTAARTCYSDKEPIDIFNKATETNGCENISSLKCHKTYDSKQVSLIKKVMDSGHLSTVEHIQFTFAISGIDRRTSHQLVRHRHASFSQKSQRYVSYNEPFGYNIPPAISADVELCRQFEVLMQDIQLFYDKAISKDILAEDARSVLPNCCHTSMVVSMNLRELIHIANLRLCKNAQEEIRELTRLMCEEVIAEVEWLKDYLVPKCIKDGVCKEHKGCGK